MAGVFVKEQRNTNKSVIVFYPSPDYLDAGKFKLPREMLKDKGSQDYAKFYASKFGSSDA